MCEILVLLSNGYITKTRQFETKRGKLSPLSSFTLRDIRYIRKHPFYRQRFLQRIPVYPKSRNPEIHQFFLRCVFKAGEPIQRATGFAAIGEFKKHFPIFEIDLDYKRGVCFFMFCLGIARFIFTSTF